MPTLVKVLRARDPSWRLLNAEEDRQVAWSIDGITGRNTS
jgi:hypothetical protein